MPKIKCKDGASLFFSIEGQGSPVVLIAGGFCDHRVWDDVTEFLKTHFQVIRYDNRGIGQSDVTHDVYNLELLADDLDCLLKQLSISAAHIIGHSMGGFVAQYFAAYYRDKVLSLALLSSLLVMNKTGANYLNHIADNLKNNPTYLCQSMPEEAGRIQTIRSIYQQITLCKEQDARSYIDRILATTLIISGLKEPIVTPEETNILADAIQNVRRTTFLNCGHMLPRESPKELGNALLFFLNGL